MQHGKPGKVYGLLVPTKKKTKLSKPVPNVFGAQDAPVTGFAKVNPFQQASKNKVRLTHGMVIDSIVSFIGGGQRDR